MEPLRRIVAIAAPLWREGVETDQIIPARLCVRPAGADYGDTLFAPWRYREDGGEDPEFVLNRGDYRRARILVTGGNFGYGSSREHAAWAVRDFGIRAIVAPSFASIFAANCIRNGVLPVGLRRDEVEEIVAELGDTPAELVVDLERQVVESPSSRTYGFEVAPLDRELLLEGVDAITLAARHADEVAAFQAADRVRRPWVYDPVS